MDRGSRELFSPSERKLLDYEESPARDGGRSAAAEPPGEGDGETQEFRDNRRIVRSLQRMWSRGRLGPVCPDDHAQALALAQQLIQRDLPDSGSIDTSAQLREELSRSSVISSADLDLLLEDLRPEEQPHSAAELAELLVRRGVLHADQAAALCRGELPTLLLGDYLVLEELGRGGMGVVYAAQQVSLRRRVALKVLPLASILDGRSFERFKNEARAAAALDHPNAVQVYAVGCASGMHYYAMQYIEGCTAADQIADARRAPPSAEAVPAAERYRRIARLGIQAAEALEHAHQLGIVHRDIKPSNLLVDAGDHLWITDFGLAMIEAEANLTVTGGMLGTLRYMSPEQTEGDRRVLDHRTDIYSLGVTLYEMLTLRPAFPDDRPQRLLRQIPQEEPPPPRAIDRRIPKDLETIVLKAIRKDPADRYPTAQALADDLKRFLESRPILAKPTTVVERAGRWMRRHTPLVGLVLAMFALAAGGFAASTFLITREQSKTKAALRTATENSSEAQHQRRRAEKAVIEANRQTRLAREMLYTSDIKLAAGALKSGDVAQQVDFLRRHIPEAGQADLRGFEWHYLWRQANLGHEELLDVGQPLYTVCFSPDGKVLATAGQRGVIRVLDAATFRETCSFPAEQGEVNGLGFHPTSGQLVSAGDDGTLRIWDLASRRLVRTIQAHETLAFQVAFTPDGNRMISCGKEPVIRLWDWATGSHAGTLERHEDAVEAIAVSPNGKVLGSASSDGTACLWNMKEQSLIFREHTVLLARTISVAFSPDSRFFAAGNVQGYIKVLEIEEDFALVKALHDRLLDGVQSIAFAHGSMRFLTGDRSGSLRLWSLDSPAAEPASGSQSVWNDTGWLGHEGRIYDIAFSPGGKRFVSVGEDGKLKVWDSVDPSPWLEMDVHEKPEDVAFLPSGETFFTANGDAVYAWNAASHARTRLPIPGDRPFNSIEVSPDGKLLAVGNDHGTVVLWNLKTDRVVRRWHVGDADKVEPLSFSPDGRLVAAALWPSHDKVQLLDLETGAELPSLPARQCEALAFSPDGKQLAAGDWHDIILYDLATGERLHVLQSRAKTITGLAFSPDGNLLASIGTDRRLAVWDLKAGRERASWIAHAGGIRAMTISPDGRTIATTGTEGSLKLWSLPTGLHLFSFPEVHPVYARAAFVDGGRRLACYGLRTVRFFDGSPMAEE